MTVRFSVCIPVWNEREWLGGAIESVLAQGHQDWELIIGDNSSSEDLYGVAARYEDERIRYHRWDTHTDLYENFNRTALLSHFEWVQILCADDRLKPDCLAKMAAQVEAAVDEGANLAMVLTACSRVDPQGRPADDAYYGHQRVMSIKDGTYDGEGWLDAMAVPGQTPWNYGSVALSKRVLSEMGLLFRPEIGLCADVELALRASAYGDVAYTSAPMLNYTVRGNSDMPGRALRNLRDGDPYTPIGTAWLAALRSHEQRRRVSPQQRKRILGCSRAVTLAAGAAAPPDRRRSRTPRRREGRLAGFQLQSGAAQIALASGDGWALAGRTTRHDPLEHRQAGSEAARRQRHVQSGPPLNAAAAGLTAG